MTTKRTQVGLHLDPDMIRDIKLACKKTGQPMTEFMREAIKAALKREAYAAKGVADAQARKASEDAETARRIVAKKGVRRVMIGGTARAKITYEQLAAAGITDAQMVEWGWMKILKC